MGTLQFCDYDILSADLGEENRMPDIKNVKYIHAKFDVDKNVPSREAANLGSGMIQTLLPYTIQNNYTRHRSPRTFRAAVLENSKLKALFLPELGGRLWSLYDKVNERELLYVNPVFQPGNLALRNAWFSGGIEWNVGIKGHNPLTCSPLFAREMKTADGDSFLRMYEYERIRDVTYCMDFVLPEESDVLFARVTIENTGDEDKYMYWWSNIAVPEDDGSRIIAPTNQALLTFYSENRYKISLAEVPVATGDTVDVTYPKNCVRAQDYFYIVPDDSDKWVANVTKNGEGFLDFSTPNLFGKKLFVWGQGQGGRNWNKWLSGEDKPYVEIQSGLARTQYEHFLMNAHSTITFTEGFGGFRADPAKLHGDFNEAIKTVGDICKEKAAGLDDIETMLKGAVPGDIMVYGSGFGYLENLAREKQGKRALSNMLDFPADSVTAREQAWLALVTDGVYPADDLTLPPPSFQKGVFWQTLLEKSEANPAARLQLGITRYASGDIQGAYAAFQQSNAAQENPWALRNLAMIEKNEYGNLPKAVEYIGQALKHNVRYRGLMLDAADILLTAGENHRWLAVFREMDDTLKGDGRLLLYKALAHINLEEYEAAAEIINKDFVMPDIQEGELSVSYIWGDLYQKLISKRTGITRSEELVRLQQEQYPLPEELNFRMH